MQCRIAVVFTLLFWIIGVQNALAWSYTEETNDTNLGNWSQTVGGDGGVKYKNSANLPNGSDFSLPAFEVWRKASTGSLTNGSITHSTINDIPNGKYKLTFEYIAISGNNNDPSGAYFDINGNTDSRITSFGSTGVDGNSRWRKGTLEKNITITNGKLDFSIVLNGANFNWIVFKNLKLEPADDWVQSWTSGLKYAELTTNNGYPEQSKVKAPCLELWSSNSNDFNGKSISRSVSVPNGRYKVTLDFSAMSQNQTQSPVGGCGFYCEDQSKGLTSLGEQFNYNSGGSTCRTGTVEFEVNVTDGSIDFRIEFAGTNFNWFLFKNFEYQLMQPEHFTHYEGIVSEMGTAPEGLKTDFKTHADDPRINEGVTLQRAHEYTHDIYLLPGQTYDLEPFSDFHSVTMYMDVYHRWFDYTTDKTSSRLSVNNSVIFKDVNNIPKGYFGGSAINGERTSACIATYTAPNSTDEIFDVIAIDVANALPDDHLIYGTEYTTLKEPTLQYRHIFVIHNAKKQADELNDKTDGAYTLTDIIPKVNVTRIMCPEGTPFQYRLENFEYRGWGSSAKPTGYYHKTGDNTYEPVYHYRVEIRQGTEKPDGSYTYNTILGSTAGNRSYDGSGNVIGTHSKTNVSSPLHGDEETLCNNMKDNLVYTYKCTNGYDAALYLKKPTVGHYLIRVYAIDASSADSYTDITTYNTSNTLILEEIELEVLPKTQANMVDEETMKADGFEYKYQRPENMLAEYGEPTTVVNFDDIKAEDVVADSNGDGYYKWPWEWESSSYGFGYDQRYDYNMYMVANRSNKTPYKASDNIYDRLYADTNGEKKGFFLYANAATDPTRMVVLNIGNNLCIGSRIYVSAWINEFNTYPEAANVVFSFKGVKKDGSEVILNNYVSGYVLGGCNTKDGFVNIPNHWDDTNGERSTTNPDYRRKWMHIYYYFDPQFDEYSGTSNSYDHFIISLENNCTGSSGADYAIDDIRAFVCKPELNALQEKPVCNGDPYTKIEFVADFDRLLSATGTKEFTRPSNASGEQCYYAVIDKAVYEKTYQEKLIEYDGDSEKYNKAHKDAYRTAVVKGIYGEDGSYEEAEDDEEINDSKYEYGWYVYDSYFEGNSLLSDLTEEERRTETSREVSGINRYLHFPSYSNLNDTKIHYDTKYWVILAHTDIVTDNNYWENFDPYDLCSARSEFEVIFSGEIKIDGKLSDLNGAQNICANQRPKIEIDLNGISKGGEKVKTENAYFDWYFGPLYDPDPSTTGTEDLDHYYYNEYYYPEEGEKVDLFHSLVEFRAAYPKAEEDDLETCDVNDKFTQEMKDCIKHFLDEGMIALYKQSEFASTYDAFNEPISSNYDSDHPRKIVMTAIPINPEPDDETIEFCLDAFQITIPVSTRTPILKNGDDKGLVPYPRRMRDVPLRIGLNELKKCCTLEGLSDSGYKFLYMPLRDVSPVTAGVNSVVKKGADDLVYLVASNDPNVEAGESGARTVTTYDDGTTPMEETIYYIGKVSDIVAKKWTRGTDDNPGNVCHLAFFKDIKFREGYWYTIKFNFVEDYDASSDENYDVCPGDVICTIKVVPEYQMWTGKVDGNWNNDKNWRRVTKEELLNPSSISDELITDADEDPNDNDESFVPADFTKVIIPADPTNIPVLYGLRETGNLQAISYIGGSGATNFVRYMTAVEEAREGETNEAVKDYYSVIGAASDTINFDMASEVLSDGNVACRSWYDHTCDEIHFNSGAKMVGQQYLHYNKAWADLELEPARWHTISMPLVGIVSGDFYLPTNGARQNTPLFEPITYSTALNDRFKPAVYQRTWNAKDANVWHLDKTQTDAANKLMIDWSHVYNETNVNYSAGIGFSVKPDVSKLDGTKPDKVLFRFPKADTQYTYYSEGNTNGDVKADVAVPGNMLSGSDRAYRLADFTTAFAQGVGENTAGGNKYFLIGNPFICDLDMEKFFEKNPRFEKKYWMLTEDGQRVTVMDDAGLITTDEYGKLKEPTVAPFQSFFVEMKEDGIAMPDTVCPIFYRSMMVIPEEAQSSNGGNNNNNNNAKSRAVTSSTAGLLRVATVDEFGHESVMILADGQQRRTAGAQTLFDSNLADEPTVYAVIMSQAMTIGEVAEGDTIPIGIAGSTGDVELSISGVDGFAQDLHIIDAVTGVSQPLTSNMTLSQTGNGVRYYLLSPKNDGIETAGFTAPTVSVDGCRLTITAPAGHELLDVTVHSSSGACHLTETNAGEQLTTRLPAGIYIVRLQCNGARYSYKLCLRDN